MDKYKQLSLPDRNKPLGQHSALASTSGYNSPSSPQIETGSFTPISNVLQPSLKGVENAKKRLRAFSIQKKTPLKSPALLPKPVAASGGTTTVLIGKLTSVKSTPKPTPVEDEKKIPKPPKPGALRKALQDSYEESQKKTLNEIEDMKRKMELVELGIPLGLICPTASYEGAMTAMPTKAMPPIKNFLDKAKVDELIREAKKAKAEGKEFKFDYQKLLPGYDNPFQRKVTTKDDDKMTTIKEDHKRVDNYSSKKRIDKYDRGYKDKHYKKESRDQYEYRRDRHKKERHRERYEVEKSETAVDLNDYLVCDSWSLDNDDKSSNSPRVIEKNKIPLPPSEKFDEISPILNPKDESFDSNLELLKEDVKEDSPKINIGRLKPVEDSFAYEIDLDDDEYKVSRDSLNDNKMDDNNKSRRKLCEYDLDSSKDEINDDTFLESIINEIKQEEMPEDSQEKGLVEYDPSPLKEVRSSVTPDLDDSVRISSQRSDYSDGFRSVDSGVKSSESGYKSESRPPSNYRLSMERDDLQAHMSKELLDSLQTWSFVLKICQPLLFRHDKKECYRATSVQPKMWYTENAKMCKCVEDRCVVYEELEMCQMNLVDSLYEHDPIDEDVSSPLRKWYPPQSHWITDTPPVEPPCEWEADDSQSHCGPRRPTPAREDELEVDREYQRFMEAIWPDITDKKSNATENSRSTTPVKTKDVIEVEREAREKETERKKKKRKISTDWSQDSEDEREKSKKMKLEKSKERRKKRKHSTSTSTISSISDDEPEKKKKKKSKKKSNKKLKLKSAKSASAKKQQLKKLKEKKRKKKNKSYSDDAADKKDKSKRSKKKKQLKLKKKSQKKKAKSSSSDTSSTSSTSQSDSESDTDYRKKRRDRSRGKRKNRRRSTDSSQSEELFDVNILNNIKREKMDEEINQKKMIEEFSPRRQQKKTQEIINVKELQCDLVDIHIKQELEESEEIAMDESQVTEKSREREMSQDSEKSRKNEAFDESEQRNESSKSLVTEMSPKEKISADNVISSENIEQLSELSVDSQEQEKAQFKEPQEMRPQPIRSIMDESNLSQCSSQESVCSVKERATYEKDDSHLRPSSQNSNYSFNDVIAQSAFQKRESIDEKYEPYEENNYEMYEEMAMAYQSDVANKVLEADGAPVIDDPEGVGHRIETVVGAGGPRGARGEIKCDWRRGDEPTTNTTATRPSRWGLKPNEVNIVLTGGNTEQYPITNIVQPVYRIENIANRNDNSTGYDEAYMDMYGASDRLQYGDCFSGDVANEIIGDVTADDAVAVDGDVATVDDVTNVRPVIVSSLDERINKVLQESELSKVGVRAEDPDIENGPEKGILVTKSSVAVGAGVGGVTSASKRVSFADGYKPGQDSDLEEPPPKKKRSRRYGCAWPCPASHPDHVPLWDALPPPPPPPSPPPSLPPARRALLPLPHHNIAHYNTPPEFMPRSHPPAPSAAHRNMNFKIFSV